MQQLILDRIAHVMHTAGWAPDVIVTMSEESRDRVVIQHDGEIYGERSIFDFCTPDINLVIGAWIQKIEREMMARG